MSQQGMAIFAPDMDLLASRRVASECYGVVGAG
jgi:hypothetical protein